MNPTPDDDAIDALLRQSFDGPLADAGFSERVMQYVPPRRRASPWPLTLCAIAGVLLCWLSLADSPLLRAAWQGWFSGHWSASTVVTLALMAALSLLALGWTLMEAQDR